MKKSPISEEFHQSEGMFVRDIVEGLAVYVEDQIRRN